MYLGRYDSLDSMHRYLTITYSKIENFNVIVNYFDIYIQFDYGFTLYYLGNHIYELSNGPLFIYFTLESGMLSLDEILDLVNDDKLNSNNIL